METKPYGWAGTRAGQMLHYFGMTREGGEGYRLDGTPLAMCHNALVAGTEELKAEPQPLMRLCDSCARSLAKCPKRGLVKELVAGELARMPLAKGQCRKVLRGALASLTVEVSKEAPHFPGFWICWLRKGTGAKQRDVEVMLSAGQLSAPC